MRVVILPYGTQDNLMYDALQKGDEKPMFEEFFGYSI